MGTTPTAMLLKCLKCGMRLDVYHERCACPQCGGEWPVIGGIPRFFEVPDYYWGEIGRSEAREMLEAARNGPWVEAVRARFSEDDNMTTALLDLQRASWMPMLGFDELSVALDIGCGYGAITHSISRSVGEVYSVEAVPERIEFTQERLRQEGIKNVRLIQASATSLPLLERSFDLVVANGVLEWVGEWDLQGDPRDAQLRFLDTIQRLLKDDGVLVIGIENRIGYGLFLGNDDHSGIPYTSLVPRRLASFMLRHSSNSHYRTKLNLRKEYRTYTYSERGYQKLLAEAGFAEVSCYWGDPGYNQPYHLIPLSMPQWVQEQFLDLIYHPGRSPVRSWRRDLKRILARSRSLPTFLPDFVLFASKRQGRRTKVQDWIQRQLEFGGERKADAGEREALVWGLYTYQFAKNAIVRLGNPIRGHDVAFLKLQVGPQVIPDPLEVEWANLAKVREAMQVAGCKLVGVPKTLGTLQVSNITYWLESVAQGEKLSRIVRRPGYFRDARKVHKDFIRLVDSAIELAKVLNGLPYTKMIDPNWLTLPEELSNPSEMRAALEAARYFRDLSVDSRKSWVQHGDLSVENVFFDRRTGRVEVVDWVDLARGGPPLYDLFSLFYSTGYVTPDDEARRFPCEEERWITSFKEVFFGVTSFALIARDLTLKACEELNVEPELIPRLLLEFLLVRSHFFRKKSVVQRRVHVRLLQLCLEGRYSIFRRFPLTDFTALSSAD